MFKNKVITFILLTAALVSSKAYCQEGIKNQQIRTVAGKVIKFDVESGAINVQTKTGTVAKQAFSGAHLNADLLWGELIKSGYIDSNGTIQAPFYELDNFSNMLLPERFNARKQLIYNIFRKALIDNGMMVFYIAFESSLLRGTHRIASLEIGQGDPVIIQYYRSSSGKNHIVRLVDSKPDTL